MKRRFASLVATLAIFINSQRRPASNLDTSDNCQNSSTVCLNMTRIMVESMVTSHSDSKEDGEVEKEA